MRACRERTPTKSISGMRLESIFVRILFGSMVWG
jgi:hypothetical protein